MMKTTLLRALPATIGLLCATGAFAQAVPTVTIHAGVGDDGLALDRANSTGSRLYISTLELPASAETISAATIAARGDMCAGEPM